MILRLFRGASPRRTPLHTRSRGPQAPLRSCGSLAALARVFISTAAIVVIGGGTRLLACPQCFGAEETALIDGTKLGIITMLAITLAVQGGFVGFFLYLRKRAKRELEFEIDSEWSELQRASKTR